MSFAGSAGGFRIHVSGAGCVLTHARRMPFILLRGKPLSIWTSARHVVNTFGYVPLTQSKTAGMGRLTSLLSEPWVQETLHRKWLRPPEATNSATLMIRDGVVIVLTSASSFLIPVGPDVRLMQSGTHRTGTHPEKIPDWFILTTIFVLTVANASSNAMSTGSGH